MEVGSLLDALHEPRPSLLWQIPRCPWLDYKEMRGDIAVYSHRRVHSVRELGTRELPSSAQIFSKRAARWLQPSADRPLLRLTFSPAHALANIFHPPDPPIALQSIAQDVPLARARAF